VSEEYVPSLDRKSYDYTLSYPKNAKAVATISDYDAMLLVENKQYYVREKKNVDKVSPSQLESFYEALNSLQEYSAYEDGAD
jgi:hypothetical protein